MSIYDKPKTFSLTTFYNAKIKFMWAGYYKQSIFGYISYYYSVMDYEYSVIGSIYCNAEVLATMAASSEFLHNGYTFLLRKFNEQLSVSLVGYASGNTSDNNIQNVCKNIPEADVTEVCKILSEKFACKVSIRKGYEVYGNANVFNGGSDYEIIEEKWFSVEFDNGCQNMTQTKDIL